MYKKAIALLIVISELITLFSITACADTKAFTAAMMELSGNTYSYVGTGVQLYKNDKAIVTTTFGTAGYYCVSIAGSFEAGTIINYCVNNRPSQNFAVYNDTDMIVLYTDIPSGSISLSLNTAVGECIVTGMNIAQTEKRVSEEFVKAVNNAETTTQMYTAFETYSQELGLDLSALTKGIFYPECAYGRLLNKGYRDINRILEDIISSLSLEKSNPSVSLFKDTTPVTAFEKAKLTLKIKSSVRDEGVTIAAIYKGNGSLFKTITFDDKDYGDIEYPIDLSNQTGTSRFRLELLYWESADNLRPINRFGEIYRDIWVSPDGSDSNSGKSPDAAFATVSRAKDEIMFLASKMNGDIVIHMASGEYFLENPENFATLHSAKNGYRVIFRGEGDTRPVITGGKKITGWTLWKNGIYKAPFDGSESLRELWVDGHAAVRARGDYIYAYSEDYDTTSGKAFAVNDTAFPKLTNHKEIELVWENMWASQRTAVESVSYQTSGETIISLDNFYQPDSLIETCKINKNDRFYVENAIELLDREGEFYHNVEEGMIYYCPPSDKNIFSMNIYAPVTEGLVGIYGNSVSQKVKNITFENLCFRHGTWTYPNNNSLVMVQAGSGYDSSGVSGIYPPAQFEIHYADNIVIRNCEFKGLGSTAVSFTEGVTNSVFEGNIMTDIGGGAISVGKTNHNIKNTSDDSILCKNITISDNYIRRTANQYRQMPAVTMYYGNGIRILNNDISDTAYSGISIGWGWDSEANRSPNTGRVLVAGNIVKNVMRTLNDGGNIYTLGYLPDTLIYGNYFDSNLAKPLYRYPGIYLDEGTRYVSVVNNVITNCSSRWLLINSTQSSLDAEISGNYSDGADATNKSGSELGENNTGLTSLPDEATKIIESAGPRAEYIHITDEDIFDEKGFELYYSTPSKYDEEGIYIEATDYVSGKVTDNGENYVSFNVGNYVNYTLKVPENKTYKFVLYAASASTSNASLAIRITGEGVDKEYYTKISPTGSYGTMKASTICTQTLSAGTYNVWIKNIGGGGYHLNRLVVK